MTNGGDDHQAKRKVTGIGEKKELNKMEGRRSGPATSSQSCMHQRAGGVKGQVKVKWEVRKV